MLLLFNYYSYLVVVENLKFHICHHFFLESLRCIIKITNYCNMLMVDFTIKLKDQDSLQSRHSLFVLCNMHKIKLSRPTTIFFATILSSPFFFPAITLISLTTTILFTSPSVFFFA